MNPKQEKFVEHYLSGMNATKAAIAAGYSEKYAADRGNYLLNENEEVKAAIAKATNASEETAKWNAETYIEKAESIMELALNGTFPNYAAALKGLEMIGKVKGFNAPEKTETTLKGANFKTITFEEFCKEQENETPRKKIRNTPEPKK